MTILGISCPGLILITSYCSTRFFFRCHISFWFFFVVGILVCMVRLPKIETKASPSVSLQFLYYKWQKVLPNVFCDCAELIPVFHLFHLHGCRFQLGTRTNLFKVSGIATVSFCMYACVLSFVGGFQIEAGQKCCGHLQLGVR